MTLRLDLHTHSCYSPDSFLKPANIIRLAKKRGFDGVAITDHVSAGGGLEGRQINEDPHFTVIPGIEYATEIGHVLGLFIRQEPQGLSGRGINRPSILPLEKVVRAIHDVGGIAVLAHPFETKNHLPDDLFSSKSPQAKENLDAVEAHNARACTRRNPIANEKARTYAHSLGVPVTGGSDAHMAFEVGRGGCVIDGLEPGANLEEIKATILAGQAVPFGIESPRIVVPMTLLIKMTKSKRYGDAPKILSQLALACLGRPGQWLEDILAKPSSH